MVDINNIVSTVPFRFVDNPFFSVFCEIVDAICLLVVLAQNAQDGRGHN